MSTHIKALVLNSGGTDSTTCLAMAIKEYGVKNVETVTVYYGQKHQVELEAAEKIAKYYGVKQHMLDISSIFQWSNCSLLKNSTQDVAYVTVDTKKTVGRADTYVPFRNGVLLSAVASLALQIFPDEDDLVKVYLGNHADDSAGGAYPDCSPEFTENIARAIYAGTDKRVQLVSPFVNDSKATIIKTGLELNVPYNLTYSCYNGTQPPCGHCNTCIDRLKAFEANGVKDPAIEG